MSPRRASRATGAPPARLVREALLIALRQTGKDKPSRQLQAIANKLVALAGKGDLYAIREVFERLEDPDDPPARRPRRR
jgi:hypothetical protein